MIHPHNKKPVHDMAMAIVGSVCGAIIPFAFDSAAEVKLIGAAVGAAIAPFVSATGRRRHLVVVLTLLVLGITYTGSQVVTEMTGVELLPPLQPATPVPQPELAVSPTLVACKPLCSSRVTLTNSGTAPLWIGSIELEGPASGNFRSEGLCANRNLAPGDQCVLTVRFIPAGTTDVSAKLAVHTGTSDPARVELTGRPTDLDLAVPCRQR